MRYWVFGQLHGRDFEHFMQDENHAEDVIREYRNMQRNFGYPENSVTYSIVELTEQQYLDLMQKRKQSAIDECTRIIVTHAKEVINVKKSED